MNQTELIKPVGDVQGQQQIVTPSETPASKLAKRRFSINSNSPVESIAGRAKILDRNYGLASIAAAAFFTAGIGLLIASNPIGIIIVASAVLLFVLATLIYLKKEDDTDVAKEIVFENFLLFIFAPISLPYKLFRLIKGEEKYSEMPERPEKPNSSQLRQMPTRPVNPESSRLPPGKLSTEILMRKPDQDL
ncbi:MAG TPA: MgtC/SapB family protein [Rhabdochlamydiaceae bacterium]|nr:MgtC/SapB family protein [Rhabdochlamydiaceae bacterium]